MVDFRMESLVGRIRDVRERGSSGSEMDEGVTDSAGVGTGHADGKMWAIGPMVAMEGILGAGRGGLQQDTAEEFAARCVDEVIAQTGGGIEQRQV